MDKEGILSLLNTIEGASVAVFVCTAILILYVIVVRIFKTNISSIIIAIYKKILEKTGKTIRNKEHQYHRELAIGKINEKTSKVKIYKFLNNLIVDLGLRSKGMSPYTFLFLVSFNSLLLSLIGSYMIFKSWVLGIVIYPIIFAGVMCVLYTRANVVHDMRIEAIIEAENIISNNIKGGVVVAIRNSIDLIPEIVRGEFREFLDNIDHKNFHVKTALLELNNNLGSVADEFIRKCIIFEMEEEHGIVGMFQDLVEMNNIKTDLRNEMKRVFEKISIDFVISFVFIIAFLGGVLCIYPAIRNFYLNNLIGQIIMSIDLLIVVCVYVLITFLKAREL